MGAGLFRDSYAQWRGNPISENCDLLWPFENKCAFTGTCVESGIGDYGICMCGPYWTDPSSVVALLSDLSWSTCTISTPLYLIIHLFGLIGSIILAYYAIEKFKKVVVYTALQAMLQECDISEEGPIREYFKSIPEFRPKVMVFVEKADTLKFPALDASQYSADSGPETQQRRSRRSILKSTHKTVSIIDDRATHLTADSPSHGNDPTVPLANPRSRTGTPPLRTGTLAAKTPASTAAHVKQPSRRAQIHLDSDSSDETADDGPEANSTFRDSQFSLYASQHALEAETPTWNDASALGGSLHEAQKQRIPLRPGSGAAPTGTVSGDEEQDFDLVGRRTRYSVSSEGEAVDDVCVAAAEDSIAREAEETMDLITHREGVGERPTSRATQVEMHTLAADVNDDDDAVISRENGDDAVDDKDDDNKDNEDVVVGAGSGEEDEDGYDGGEYSDDEDAYYDDEDEYYTESSESGQTQHQEPTTTEAPYALDANDSRGPVNMAVYADSTSSSSESDPQLCGADGAAAEAMGARPRYPLLHILWEYPEVRQRWWPLLVRAKIFQVSSASLIWAAYSCAHCLYFSLHLISALAGYPSFSPQEPLINTVYFGIFMGLLNASLAVCLGVLVDFWNIALHFLSLRYQYAVAYARHLLWFCDNYDYLIRVYLNYYLFCYTHKINITDVGVQVFDFLDASPSTNEKPRDFVPLQASTGNVLNSLSANLAQAPGDAASTDTSGSNGSSAAASNTAESSPLTTNAGADAGSSGTSVTGANQSSNIPLSVNPRLDSDLMLAVDSPTNVADMPLDRAVDQVINQNKKNHDQNQGEQNIVVSADTPVNDASTLVSSADRAQAVQRGDGQAKVPLAPSVLSGSGSSANRTENSIALPQLSQYQYNVLEKKVFNFFSSLYSTHICQPRVVHATMYNIYKAVGLSPIKGRCLNDQISNNAYHPYNITYNAFRRTVAAMHKSRSKGKDKKPYDARSPMDGQPHDELVLLHQLDKGAKLPFPEKTEKSASPSSGLWKRIQSMLSFRSESKTASTASATSSDEFQGDKVPLVSATTAQLLEASSSDAAVALASVRAHATHEYAETASDGDDSESTDDDSTATGRVFSSSRETSLSSRAAGGGCCSDDTVLESDGNRALPSSLTDPRCSNRLPPVKFDGKRYFPEFVRLIPEPFTNPMTRFRVIRGIFVVFFMLSFLITIAVLIPSPKIYYGSVTFSVYVGGSLTVFFFFGILNVAVYLGLNILPALYWSKFDGNEVLNLLKFCDRLAYIRAGEIMVMLRNNIKNESFAFATFFALAKEKDSDLLTSDPFHAEAHLEDVVEEDFRERRVSLSVIREDENEEESDVATAESATTADTKNTNKTGASSACEASSHGTNRSLLFFMEKFGPPSCTRNGDVFENTVYPELVKTSPVNTQKFMQVMGVLAMQTCRAEFASLSSKFERKLPSEFSPRFIDANVNAFTEVASKKRGSRLVPSRKQSMYMPCPTNKSPLLGEKNRRLQVLFLHLTGLTRSQQKKFTSLYFNHGSTMGNTNSRPSYMYRNTQYPSAYQSTLTSTVRASSLQTSNKTDGMYTDASSVDRTDVGYGTSKPSLRRARERKSLRERRYGRYGRPGSPGADVSRCVQSLRSATYNSQSGGSMAEYVEEPTLAASASYTGKSRSRKRRPLAKKEEVEEDVDETESIFSDSMSSEANSHASQSRIVRDIECAPVDYSGSDAYANEEDYHVEKNSHVMAVVDARYCLIHAKIHKHSHRCNRSVRRNFPNIINLPTSIQATQHTRVDNAVIPVSSVLGNPQSTTETCVSVDGFSAEATQVVPRDVVPQSRSATDSGNQTAPVAPKQADKAETVITNTSSNGSSAVISQLLSPPSNQAQDYYSSLPALSAFTNTSARLVYPTLVLPSVLNVPLPIPNSPFPPPFQGTMSKTEREKKAMKRFLRNTDEYTSETENTIVKALKVCIVAILYCNCCITPSAFVPIIRNFFLIYAAGNIVITSFIMWKMLRLTKDDPIQDMKKDVMAKLRRGATRKRFRQSVFMSVQEEREAVKKALSQNAENAENAENAQNAENAEEAVYANL